MKLKSPSCVAVGLWMFLSALAYGKDSAPEARGLYAGRITDHGSDGLKKVFIAQEWETASDVEKSLRFLDSRVPLRWKKRHWESAYSEERWDYSSQQRPFRYFHYYPASVDLTASLGRLPRKAAVMVSKDQGIFPVARIYIPTANHPSGLVTQDLSPFTERNSGEDFYDEAPPIYRKRFSSRTVDVRLAFLGWVADDSRLRIRMTQTADGYEKFFTHATELQDPKRQTVSWEGLFKLISCDTSCVFEADVMTSSDLGSWDQHAGFFLVPTLTHVRLAVDKHFARIEYSAFAGQASYEAKRIPAIEPFSDLK